MPRGTGATFAAAAAALALGASPALAAQGNLDASFSGDGKLVQDVATSRTFDVAVDSKSRIVIAGHVDPPGADIRDTAVARFLPNGLPDLSFSGDGVVTVDGTTSAAPDAANALVIDPQGRIVIAGQATQLGDGNSLLIRLTDAGAPDTSFSGDGVLVSSLGPNEVLTGIAVDSAGRYVAGGSIGNSGMRNYLVERVTAAGVLDASYGGGDGFEDENVNSVASNDFGDGLALDSQGRAIVAGVTELAGGDQNFGAVRFTAGGLLDTTFSNDLPTPGRQIQLLASQDGTHDDDAAQDVVALPGDKVVLAGYAEIAGADYEIALLQLTNTGVPDTSFSGDGKAYAGFGNVGDEAGSVALDPQGRIVVGGDTDPVGPPDDEFVAARFAANGAPDPAFGGDGLVSTDVGPGSDVANAVAIDPVTKRVVLAGDDGPQATADWALARYEGVPRCGGKVPTIAGALRNDRLKGTKGKDVISGGPANDRIKGAGKADIICGEDGKDKLLGGKGNDRLLGGKGRDKLYGGAGKDKLKGGAGKDVQRQ